MIHPSQKGKKKDKRETAPADPQPFHQRAVLRMWGSGKKFAHAPGNWNEKQTCPWQPVGALPVCSAAGGATHAPAAYGPSGLSKTAASPFPGGVALRVVEAVRSAVPSQRTPGTGAAMGTAWPMSWGAAVSVSGPGLVPGEGGTPPSPF
mmetsp:Transcript_65158/g.109180  ORF Transcript_65158/g.109180 Transcript_65158/m.109180 type:complete len:149 (-) Transcript_65158:37-483(-)